MSVGKYRQAWQMAIDDGWANPAEPAKERQGTRTDIVETFPPSSTDKSRDKVGHIFSGADSRSHRSQN